MMNLEKKIEKWSDQRVLEEFAKFLSRVVIRPEFVQDADGLVTHHVLMVTSGDKYFASEALPLSWPMQPLPIPEAFEGKLN